MSLFAHVASSPGKDGDRKAVTVPVPNAHAGIASALKASYAALPVDEQFNRLLAHIK